jgi:hypothetical protein
MTPSGTCTSTDAEAARAVRPSDGGAPNKPWIATGGAIAEQGRCELKIRCGGKRDTPHWRDQAPALLTRKSSQRSKFRCCARNIADILNPIADPVLRLHWAFKGRVQMTALQGFLLGLMVAWTPSVIFLACIAVQAESRRNGRASEVRKSIDRTMALHNP